MTPLTQLSMFDYIITSISGAKNRFKNHVTNPRQTIRLLSFSSTGLVHYLNTCESRQATDLRLNQIFDLSD